jgi:hypothetical protein
VPLLQGLGDGGSRSERRNDDQPQFRIRIVTVAPADRQRALDRALEETFPASDPISITITEVVRVTPGRSDVH